MILKWHSGSITLIKGAKLQKQLRTEIAGMLCGLAHEIENIDQEIKMPIRGTIKTEIDMLDVKLTLELEWPTEITNA